MKLSRIASNGAAITVATQILKIAVQFSSIVLLARLLTPDDYGTLASALVVIGFGEVLRDAGLSTATIQAKSICSEQQTKVFLVNSAIGLLLCFLAYVAAEPVSLFFKNPDVKDIVRALSGSFLIGAFGAQYRAALTRTLKFHRIAFSDIASQVAAVIVAATLAIKGFGVWALVFQYLTQVSSATLINLIGCKWAPRLPIDAAAPIGKLVRFGLHLLGTQIIGTASKSADSAAVGRFLGQESLGLYNRGSQIVVAPYTQLTIACTSFVLPVLSSIDDEDGFISALRRFQRLILTLLFLILMLVAVFSDPLLTFVMGDKWAKSADITACLAIALMFQAAHYPTYWIFVSKGWTPRLLKVDLLLKPAGILLVAAGASVGVYALILSIAVSAVCSWCVYLRVIAKAGVDVGGLTRDAALLLMAFFIPASIANAFGLIADVGFVGLVALKSAAAIASFATIALLVSESRKVFQLLLSDARTSIETKRRP